LAGYYRKFVQNYGLIDAPLMALLRKSGFGWTDTAAAAFQALKAALTTAPVLALSDFIKIFIVECDTSSYKFRTVLLQYKRPLAFYIRSVAPQHASLAAYERELIGLVQAVRHWRPYLWGRHFRVRTDHYNLKFLLDQRLATIPQHHWVGKLLGFDFEVEYKPGSTNIVADALSRRNMEAVLAFTMVAPRFSFINNLRQAHITDPALVALSDDISTGRRATPRGMVDGMVTFDSKLYIQSSFALLQEIVGDIHNDDHEGIKRTLHRLRHDLYAPNLRATVQEFIKGCLTCQRYKTNHMLPGGFLLPLLVPKLVLADITLDFIEGLPKVGGKSIILTVVDRFSKYGHFNPLVTPTRRKESPRSSLGR
jgi:hypothetical protein